MNQWWQYTWYMGFGENGLEKDCMQQVMMMMITRNRRMVLVWINEDESEGITEDNTHCEGYYNDENNQNDNTHNNNDDEHNSNRDGVHLAMGEYHMT